MEMAVSLSDVPEMELYSASEEEISTSQTTTIKNEPVAITETETLSRCDAFINLLKCFCGSSLFTLPGAFAQSGLLNGCVSTIILGVLTYFTLCWLGECSHLVCTTWSYIVSSFIL